MNSHFLLVMSHRLGENMIIHALLSSLDLTSFHLAEENSASLKNEQPINPSLSVSWHTAEWCEEIITSAEGQTRDIQ